MTDIDTLRATLGDKAVRVEQIGGQVLIQGDCLEVLRAMPANSADSIVTDPPYGLSFMGKAWDKGVPGVEVWREALRVLKPGGHLLAFAGTRTQHRMATAIEDAGFEIRDMIAWVYGSGFPKSLNVSKAIDKAAGAEREVVGRHSGSGMTKSNVEQGAQARNVTEWNKYSDAPATPEAQQWDGWGTALKPSTEPVTVARKPLAKGNTVAANVLAHGTGALNVDGCRVATTPEDVAVQRKRTGGEMSGDLRNSIYGGGFSRAPAGNTQGRWPANLIHDGSDEVVGLFPVTKSGKMKPTHTNAARAVFGQNAEGGYTTMETYGDTGSAARYFYCAKASKRDRDEGLPEGATSTHPTVKPTDLMRYLCRLVTPPGGVVLDPFMGSGSTGKACALEGFAFIGIDVDPNYVEIARARIGAAQREADKPTQEGLDL